MAGTRSTPKEKVGNKARRRTRRSNTSVSAEDRAERNDNQNKKYGTSITNHNRDELYNLSSDSDTDLECDSEEDSNVKERISSRHVTKRVKRSNSRPPKHISGKTNTVSTYTESKQLHPNFESEVSMSDPDKIKKAIILSRIESTMKTNLKKYLRRYWYKYTKFYSDQKKPIVHLKAAISEGHISLPAVMGLTTDEFIQMYVSKIRSVLGDLRRNSVQNMKHRYESKCVQQ